MGSLLQKLVGRDRRSIGSANEVAAIVLGDSSLFDELFTGLFHADPRVRMRAADAIQKIADRRPELLQPYRKRLLREVAAIEQQEVQWHLAQMLGRVKLSALQVRKAASILLKMLDESDNQIVKVNSLQALADLAGNHRALNVNVAPLIQEFSRTGGRAVRARARRLLKSKAMDRGTWWVSSLWSRILTQVWKRWS